jgi:hypothetical protein
MPLFPDLFLRDSHFGNSVLMTTAKIGKVTGISLVDETSELTVISQFGKGLALGLLAASSCEVQAPVESAESFTM